MPIAYWHHIIKMRLLKKYILEAIVFIGGASVMVFELVGSRVLAPYVGTSIYVWASLIGIILGSLSLGYYLGGKLSDKKPNYQTLAIILLAAAILIAISTLYKNIILSSLSESIQDIRLNAAMSTLILFSAPTIFLGMISPYAAKLKLTSLNTSGATVGNLYAISTIGSIVGTFLAGFWLIPHFGSTKILFFISIVLIVASVIAAAKKLIKTKIILITLCVFGIYVTGVFNDMLSQNGFLAVNTQYNDVWIFNSTHEPSGRPIKQMRINNESSSAIFLDGEDLVFKYTKFYDLAQHLNPGFKSALMIGGAAYAYPTYYLKTFPEATIDVVEIDPQLTELAKQHFSLTDSPRLNIYHQDGRIFLNHSKNKYDIIFGDAFKSSYSVPHQLTTKEAIQQIYTMLNDDGVAIVNIIATLEGVGGKFMRAEYATFKEVFNQTYIFAVSDPKQTRKVQNIIIVGIKSDKPPLFTSHNPEIDQMLKHLWTKNVPNDVPILVDDHAPVEYYINKISA